MRKFKITLIDLLKFGHKYGVVNAFLVAISNLFDSKIKIYLGSQKMSFKLRRGTSDVEAFKQVFIWEEYKYPVKDKVNVIIDAGANIGCASIWFSHVFNSPTIVALEPEKSNYDLMVDNTASFSNITCVNKGLWYKTANLVVENANADKWNFTLKELPPSDTSKGAIPAVSFGEIIEQYKFHVVDILKIDIEGTEKIIFASADLDWLKKVKYIFIETHDFMIKESAKTVTAAIFKYNFSMFTCGENLVFVNQDLLV